MNERNLYEALNRLKNDRSYSIILEWLREQREDSRARLETQMDNIQLEQGKAQAIKKILESIDKAPDILAKIVK